MKNVFQIKTKTTSDRPLKRSCLDCSVSPDISEFLYFTSVSFSVSPHLSIDQVSIEDILVCLYPHINCWIINTIYTQTAEKSTQSRL